MDATTSTTKTNDAVRAEVERQLHAFVDLTIAVPLALASGARSCLTRRLGVVCGRVARPMRMVLSILDLAGGGAVAPSRPPESPAAASSGTRIPAAQVAPVERATASPGGVADLAIEEYESLAASQVVARLASLTPGELDAVRRFEVGHRGRRTVLGKIDQLLA